MRFGAGQKPPLASQTKRVWSGSEEIAKQQDIRLQLTGDIHVVSHKTRSVPYRTGGALAGCWWNPKAERLCPDLSPQGYLIYRVEGENLEHFYKGLGQRVSIISHRVGAIMKRRAELQAHLVQPQTNEALEYSVNGQRWMPMSEISRPFYRAVYQSTVDTRSLADGVTSLSVRNTTGEIRTLEVVVANGSNEFHGRSDAVLTLTVGADTGWTTHKPPTGGQRTSGPLGVMIERIGDLLGGVVGGRLCRGVL